MGYDSDGLVHSHMWLMSGAAVSLLANRDW